MAACQVHSVKRSCTKDMMKQTAVLYAAALPCLLKLTHFAQPQVTLPEHIYLSSQLAAPTQTTMPSLAALISKPSVQSHRSFRFNQSSCRRTQARCNQSSLNDNYDATCTYAFCHNSTTSSCTHVLRSSQQLFLKICRVSTY